MTKAVKSPFPTEGLSMFTPEEWAVGRWPGRTSAEWPPWETYQCYGRCAGHPKSHSLVVITEAVRWLLVLAVHPALFAVTHDGRAQHRLNNSRTQ